MNQGFFAVRRTCPSCQGSGKRIESPCITCSGNGQRKVNKKLKVKIPAGVYEGAQVRVTGEGEGGMHGAPSGDLYIVIALKAHNIFTREGADLHCTMPVTFPQAAMGAEVEAPTLNGRIRIKIPAGTEGGKVFRLRSHGVPDVRNHGQKGDLYVKVHIAIPRKMSNHQQKLLREFAESAGDEVYPERSSFLDRVKSFWDDLAGEGK